jgi:hypothetical protein
MAIKVSIVPPASGGAMSAQYFEDFIVTTLGITDKSNIIQILETGPRPVIIYDNGA